MQHVRTAGSAPARQGAPGCGARHRPSRGAVAAAVAVLVLVLAAWTVPAPARAAGLSVDLDQWASLDDAWQNGNLNGNNARYPEGGVIPFRLAIEGLKAGVHTITISYDFTASGHKAYDFLATWNATNHPGLCQPSGGAISSMCPGLPASSSFAFPSDPYRANGLRVSDAEQYSGASRRLTIYGATIEAISGPTHDGSPNGNSTAELHVRFRATKSAVLLAWGGHLAQSSFWDVADGGARDGASMVSGAPWHMRTLNLDGGGARNQDRSIQPSAVVGELPPRALAPTPRPAAPTPRPRAPGDPAAPATPHRPTVPPTASVAGRVPTGPDDGAWVALIGLLAAGASVAWTRRRRPTGGRPA